MKWPVILVLAVCWTGLVIFACTFKQAISIVADKQDKDTA